MQGDQLFLVVQLVVDCVCNSREYDRVLVFDERTKLVARKVTQFLKESGDRYQKAVVFCVDQEHAAQIRQALINENADLVAQNHRHLMRITTTARTSSCSAKTCGSG